MDDDLVVVYVSQGPLAAEVAKSKLESFGLFATLRYAPVGRVLGLTIDGLGRVDVLVPPEDAARARELLAEEDEPPTDSDPVDDLDDATPTPDEGAD